MGWPSAPPLSPLTPRAEQIVDTALHLLEDSGPEALTMRTLAERLGIRAPSLYKHLPDKPALEAALIERGLLAMAEHLYAALGDGEPPETQPPRPLREGGAVHRLLRAYRAQATSRPNLYRLCTAGELPRARLTPGLEDWAGAPFYHATGDPYRAQALWSFAHGMVILEIDGRFPPDSALDITWARGAEVFSG
ncbi:TetR/AcrR family transcriptional regulator [Phytoactinopolyspora limicola]|uniref:TetR/AcrR family transcriptional regulator n=1 Tax=Phytoactinopolyspora limicola TaxID=2715536 RepID=UPI0014075E8A|nr:TetR/AcrR family transcriptional regulator [Phytoactinopolyspora limicola]